MLKLLLIALLVVLGIGFWHRKRRDSSEIDAEAV
jgi:hypothetical protein